MRAVPRAGLVVRVTRVETLELLVRIDHVRDVEEGVALQSDVDERALHARQHLRDSALVNVADRAALAVALDE